MLVFLVASGLQIYNNYAKTKLSVDFSLVGSGLLFLIAGHFLVVGFLESDIARRQGEIERKYDELSRKVEETGTRIIDSLKGVEIEFFDDINKVDLYIAERIKEATSCVYDCNWQDSSALNPRHRNQPQKQYASNALDKSIKAFCAKKATPRAYKELFTFSYPANVAKLKDHMTCGPNYSCGYFENTDAKSRFPKLQFVAIDDEEIIFVSSAYVPNLCAIKNRRIASIFCSYFDQAWELGVKIKEADYVDHQVVDHIVDAYGPVVLGAGVGVGVGVGVDPLSLTP